MAENLMEINLIINADDFGLTESICEGIKKAHLEGILTSATLLAGAQYSQYAAAIARECRGLSVGAHLQLVAGRPVTKDLQKISTLIDENGFFPGNYVEFFKKWHLGKISPQHIKTELFNQIRKIISLGINPSHADSHQHLHMHPGLLPIFTEVLKDAQIFKLRNPVEPFNLKFHGILKFSKGNIIKTLFFNPVYNIWYKNKIKKSGLNMPDVFFGQFFSGNMTIENVMPALEYYKKLIFNGSSEKGKPLVIEMMTHPGYSAAEYENIDCCDDDFKKYKWRQEFDMLTSKEVKSFINDAGIKLVNYNF